MKKIVTLALAIGLFVSSCLPAAVTDIPAPAVDLNATADVFVQQTLQAFPSVTTAPTNTPVVVTETATTAPSETPTVQAETSITSTGTLSINTAITFTSTQATTLPGTLTAFTFTPIASAGATETLHARFYGTLPPKVPYNSIELVNKAKAEAYISLQVTLPDGSVTILEYPVAGLFAVQAPVGKYKYVAWVGGNKITGTFVLDASTDLRITIFKDRIEVKKR